MKDMKRTFVKMMLLAVLSAIAGQSWADDAKPQINPGKYTGGSMIFRGETNGSIDFSEQIYEADPGATVYILTTANSTHSLNGIQWHVVKSGPSSQAQSRAETAGYAAEIVVTQIDLTTYKFSMPQDGSNVTVNAVFPDKPSAKVSYFDPTAAPGEQEKTHVAYILEGTETGLGVEGKETWYYCPPATDANDGAGFTYAKALNTVGDIHLILADGCKMSVGTADSRINDDAFRCYMCSLVIYGQTAGSGTLSAYSNTNAIYNPYGPLTINGGTVIANGTDAGLATWDSPLTINGGTIDATATDGNGIKTHDANIAILGGKVSATGKANGIANNSQNIILGWRHPSDYIYAKGYSCGNGNVMTVDGKRFVAVDSENKASVIFGSTSGSGETALPNDISLTNADAEKTIAGKTLLPIAVAETDAQGATTVSPGFLLSVTASGITPANKENPAFTLGTTPYYIYKAGGVGVTIPVSVKNYGQTGADFTVSIDGAADTSLPDAAVSISGGLATAALPWTGARDVELKSARYYCTGVSYLDWSDAQKKLVPATTYVDTDTDPNDPSANSPAPGNTTKVYILTGGGATTLDGGCYVVNNWNTSESNNSGIDAFYTGTVRFQGDTHLILADYASMSVGTSQSPSTGNGIEFTGSNLAIYAQSMGDNMGKLFTFPAGTNSGINATTSSSANSITINGGNIVCTVNSGNGINIISNYRNASVTINGGNISCEGSRSTGIYALSSDYDSSVSINGGNFTVKGDNMTQGIEVNTSARSIVTINDGFVDLNVINHGINVGSVPSTSGGSTIAIYGGKVKDTSTFGFNAYSSNNDGEIILGWKNADDYIFTNNFDFFGTVRTVDGQYLMACTSPDGSGTAFTGTLDAADIEAIKGKYLLPAMYTISAPQDVTLSVADNVGTVDPVTVGSGDAAKTFYLYDPDNTVTASLKNESFETDFEFVDPLDNYVYLDLPDGTNTNEKVNANSVTVKMPALDFKFITYGLRIPSDGKKYLAFVDDIENLTADYNDAVILVFLGLEKNPSTGAIEAVFEQADRILYGMTLSNGDKNMVPEGLPVIFAYKTEGHNLPEAIRVSEPTSANADAAAETIRQAASPLFMTGTAGQTVADVLRAALTDAGGNPLLDSNNLPLSLDAADYVIFLFDADKFVPVAASASSKLTGRRYLLVVDKVTLLQLLNGSASAARSRDSSATDGLTAASARADNGSARVWTFPLILGNDATGISSMFNVQSSMDTWFTIDGRRLQNRPAHKGVYINNGKKTVIK